MATVVEATPAVIETIMPSMQSLEAALPNGEAVSSSSAPASISSASSSAPAAMKNPVSVGVIADVLELFLSNKATEFSLGTASSILKFKDAAEDVYKDFTKVRCDVGLRHGQALPDGRISVPVEKHDAFIAEMAPFRSKLVDFAFTQKFDQAEFSSMKITVGLFEALRCFLKE
jgi:hypothetical protein